MNPALEPRWANLANVRASRATIIVDARGNRKPKPTNTISAHNASPPLFDSHCGMGINIVIPIKIEQLKLWSRWALEATSWLICLGLLAASGVVAAIAVLAWLVSGSNTLLVIGITSGLSLGLAGVWQLLRRLDRAASQLLRETPAVG